MSIGNVKSTYNANYSNEVNSLSSGSLNTAKEMEEGTSAPPAGPGNNTDKLSAQAPTGSIRDAGSIDFSGLSATAAMMLVMVRNAAEQRKTGHEVRMAQADSVQGKLMDAAEHMKSAAIAGMVTGVVAGVASGVMSVVSIVGTARGTANIIKNEKVGLDSLADKAKTGVETATQAASDVSKTVTEAATSATNAISSTNTLASKAQAWNGVANSIMSTGTAVGQGIQGLENAKAKIDEAQAERIRTERERVGELNSSLQEMIQTTMQLMQTMLEKETETMTRIMA